METLPHANMNADQSDEHLPPHEVVEAEPDHEQIFRRITERNRERLPQLIMWLERQPYDSLRQRRDVLETLLRASLDIAPTVGIPKTTRDKEFFDALATGYHVLPPTESQLEWHAMRPKDAAARATSLIQRHFGYPEDQAAQLADEAVGASQLHEIFEAEYLNERPAVARGQPIENERVINRRSTFQRARELFTNQAVHQVYRSTMAEQVLMYSSYSYTHHLTKDELLEVFRHLVTLTVETSGATAA